MVCRIRSEGADVAEWVLVDLILRASCDATTYSRTISSDYGSVVSEGSKTIARSNG